MNKKSGMKKRKNTIRWLAGLIISILMLTSISLPVKGVQVTGEKLENDVGYVDDIDRESIASDNKLDSNNMNNNQNTNDSSNENLGGESSSTIYSTEQSTESSIVSTLSEVEIIAENYYKASLSMNNSSTNDHYLAEGIYIDNNGEANIIIALKKNSNSKSIVKVKIGDKEILSPTVMDISTGTFVLKLPNRIEEFENQFGFLIINIGKIEGITETFNFAIDTPTGGEYGTGWDLVGATIKVDINYSIEKNVVKNGVVIDNPDVKIGDEIIYEVTIKNDSEVPLREIKVTDIVPGGLRAMKINGNETAESNQTGTITIAENVTLAKKNDQGSSITYVINAIVSDNAVAGKKTNTATMSSKYIIPKSDTADVTVFIRNLTVKKIILGNMGEITRKFEFNMTVDGVDFGMFQLAHNEVKNIPNIPSNGTLKLSELNSDDYGVEFTVNGIKQTVAEGICTINLGDYKAGNLDIVVTNTKNVPIDTGVLLDSLPYIIILFVVIIGGSLFFINKRRRGNYS